MGGGGVANVGIRREQWVRPFGIVRPVYNLAILTQRYMHDYGVTRDHLCNVAMAARAHANLNPAAIMHKRPMTRDDYYAARWVCAPLNLFDCCLENDAALAFVMVASPQARDCRQKPAYVHAFAQGITRDSVTLSNYYADDVFNTQTYATSSLLWRNSDFQPEDVDVAQIYDAFTTEVLISLEAFGFCKRGESGAFTDDGAIGPGGRFPVNTGGGNLSEGYLHGFTHIYEAVSQIRGTSTAQVINAESSFVSSSELVPNSALLLRG